MDFEQLEQLIMIQEEKTLSRAAQKLHLSQPALTRSMQRLEEDLGFPLFERSKNRIALSATGELAVEKARSLLEQKENMIDELRTFYNRSQSIVMAGCAPIPVLGLSRILKARNPERRLFSEIEADSQVLLERLKAGEIDLAVLPESVHLKGFLCEPLMEEHLFVLLPLHHPLAEQKELTFAMINGDPILHLKKTGFWQSRTLSLVPDSRILMQESAAITDEIVKASDLLRFKTDITLQQTAGPLNRVVIPLSDPEAHATYYAVYPRSRAADFRNLHPAFQILNWKEILKDSSL